MWTTEFDVIAEHNGTPEDLKGLLLSAYAELRKNDSAVSVQMWAAVADDRVTFKIVTPDSTREQAMRCASAVVRDALHQAGGSTPGWVETTERLIAAFEESRVVCERVPVAA